MSQVVHLPSPRTVEQSVLHVYWLLSVIGKIVYSPCFGHCPMVNLCLMYGEINIIKKMRKIY